MKRICALLLIFIITAAATACSQQTGPAETPASTQGDAQNTAVVTFDDPVLEAMVCGVMGKPEGGITAAEAQAVTRLNLSIEWQRYISQVTPIKEIGGLEYFKNLESLDLSFHAITDVTPLAGLKKLTSLSLGGNPVADIAPLAGLTNLKVLALTGCAAQDYSPLAKLVNLNLLMLDHATITDVSPLASLTSLKHLYLADCPISNYFPLSDLYQSLEQKDFTIAFTLAELGFIMDGGKQAIYDGERASVRINHIEWGAPPEDWMKNCVRTVFGQNEYKIDIGYYPNFDAYVVLAFKDGNMAVNYVYDHANESFLFDAGDRGNLERAVLAIFADTDAEDVLLTPVQIFHDILTETLGIPADTLFEMPFDEADDTLPSLYEKLGFTMLDYKGTCFYEEQTPHELNISVHRTQWDEAAPAENRVDWSMEFYDSDVNGYSLLVLYYEAEGIYRVSIEKDGAEAGIETRPVTGEKGGEWPDLDTAHRMFNDAFGTKDKELYDWAPAYFEQVLQERFGMSVEALYALPIQ